MAPVIIAKPGRSARTVSQAEPILSNIAAEFVEVKAGREICRRATGSPVEGADGKDVGNNIVDIGGDEDSDQEQGRVSPKFVGSLDRFVPGDEPQRDYYEQSRKTMEAFQETLKRFTKTLQERKMFKDANIEYRDPANYDLAYVLKIAESIREHEEGLANTQRVKGFVRKFCKGTSKHKDTLNVLLGMVPTDVYGSVISGGISLILFAAERQEAQRVEIQGALARIPDQLDEVKALSKVYIKSPELHARADGIFLAIFVVLERIVEKISRTWRENLPWSKEKRDKEKRGDVPEAIEVMKEKVKQFQQQVNICMQYRIDEGLNPSASIEGDRIEGGIMVLKCAVYGGFYTLLTSNPNFDPTDGRMRRILALNPVSAMPSMGVKRTGSIFPIEQMVELARTWLSRLGEFDPLSERHISECMSGVSKLSPEEKDQVQWIMAEDALTDWLRLTDSRLLSIQAESAPANLFNAMSFTAATLAFTLGTTTDYAVLSFFCGLRTNDSRDNADSGPKAVLKSLNGQLLSFITSKRPTADLSFLEGKKLMAKSRKTWEYAKKLFRKLLGALPERDVVFVILDSFSRLGGTGRDAEKGNELIEELHALTKAMPLVIKVLVTDALPKCPIRELADQTLYIRDDVDGWRNDFSASMLEEKKKAVIDEFRDRLAKGDSSSEEEESDSSSDSLSW